jgi:hypothetical protein
MTIDRAPEVPFVAYEGAVSIREAVYGMKLTPFRPFGEEIVK